MEYLVSSITKKTTDIIQRCFSILNTKYQIPDTTPGFTLIELLITSVLSAMIMLMVTTTFYGLLKITSRSEASQQVKQNGDYAMSVITRLTRNAVDITSTCNGAPFTNLTIRDQNGNSSGFSCFNPGNGVTQIASASASTAGPLTSSEVTLGSTCPGTLTFICTTSPSGRKSVSISFTLSHVESLTNPVSVDFTSTVALRN